MKNQWRLFDNRNVLKNKARNTLYKCNEFSFLKPMPLRKGDIVSVSITKDFIRRVAVRNNFFNNFEWLSRKWIYKNKLCAWLHLPHWKIFCYNIDIFKYTGVKY